VEGYICEKWEAGSWGQEELWNLEEGELPLLEGATKQRLVKTEKTVYVLYLQGSLERVTQWDCRRYL
jgi:hypothetical protein